MSCIKPQEDQRKKEVQEMARLMLHRHYCRNDEEAFIAWMDDDIVWIGAGDREFATGKEKVAAIFREFIGEVPRCIITREEYAVDCLGPDVYLCSGRAWISTDTSTLICLRVHQRFTFVFRWNGTALRCCHLHVSNPYSEMADEDKGFPANMARQSYQYLQEQLLLQKRQLEEQTELLQKMSYEDSLTQLYNRNKFNQLMNTAPDGQWDCLGVAYFDLNGLKEINDHLGHSAGDALLRRAADQLRAVFDGRAYRTGGDEFVVVDGTMDEESFEKALAEVRRRMDEAGISYATGLSWRQENCCLKEQIDEADRRMYQEKRRFYRARKNE